MSVSFIIVAFLYVHLASKTYPRADNIRVLRNTSLKLKVKGILLSKPSISSFRESPRKAEFTFLLSPFHTLALRAKDLES